MDTPQQVMNAVYVYLHARKLKHADLAKLFGYKSQQTITNIFNGNKYFKYLHADILCNKFPDLNYEYLTIGKGSLIKKETIPDCVQVMGNCKDQFYTYVFEVFQKTAYALQNKDVTLIFTELNNLASKLNIIEKNGNFSDEETKIVIKLSKALIDNILPNI